MTNFGKYYEEKTREWLWKPTCVVGEQGAAKQASLKRLLLR